MSPCRADAARDASPGHVKTLQRARSLGDYLIVGVVNDEQVNKHRGANYPIMNLNERVLR